MHVILKKDEFKKHENALNLKKIEKHVRNIWASNEKAQMGRLKRLLSKFFFLKENEVASFILLKYFFLFWYKTNVLTVLLQFIIRTELKEKNNSFNL